MAPVCWSETEPVLSQVRTVVQDGVTWENRLDYDYDGEEQLIGVISSLVNVTASTTVLLRRQVLTYYGTDEDYGTEGDLKTSTIQVPDGSGGWLDHETTYMRFTKTGTPMALSMRSSSCCGPNRSAG